MWVYMLKTVMISSLLMILVLQWNARSRITNWQKLKRFVWASREQPQELCIQETWLKPHLNFVVPRYVSLRKDSTNSSGGECAVFIQEGIQYRRVRNGLKYGAGQVSFR